MTARLPRRAWERLIVGACLFVFGLLGMEAFHRDVAIHERAQVEFGARFEGMLETPVGRASHDWRVVDVAEGSPVSKKLARGDVVRFTDPFSPWRRYSVGDNVCFDVLNVGSARRCVTLDGPSAPVLLADRVDSAARMLLTVLALAFCLLVGFQGHAQPGYRLLSLCFLALSLNLFITFNYLRFDWAFTVGKLANLVAYPLSWYLCAAFFLGYRNYPHTRLRLWLLRLFFWYRLLAFGCAAYALSYGIGNEAPGLAVLTLATAGGGLALTLTSLADGLAQSSGELRHRHRWLLLSVGLGTIPSMLAMMPALSGQTSWGLRWMALACYAGLVLMYVGFVYAVLRHRVFNFGFALSRALMFGVISTLLVASIGFVEWLLDPAINAFFHTDDAEPIVEAAVAVAVYLCFHVVHDKVEHRVKAVLFKPWNDKKHALCEFARRAAHITEQHVLAASLVEALDRFTDNAGAALYLQAPDGRFCLVAGSLAAMPDLLDPDAAERERLHLCDADCGICAPAGLGREKTIFPINHRGRLNGMVVVGQRADGETYRPDECKAMAYAAQQVGVDIDTLRIEQLDRRREVLQAKADVEEAALRLLAGRRTAPRATTAAAPPRTSEASFTSH